MLQHSHSLSLTLAPSPSSEQLNQQSQTLQQQLTQAMDQATQARHNFDLISLQYAQDQEVNDKLAKETEALERQLTAVQKTDPGNEARANGMK